MSPTVPHPLAAAATQWWQQTAPRERRLILSAAVLIALALLWWLVIAPPLRVWQQDATRQQQLDAQWQQLLGLQQQAQALQTRPALSHDAAARALEASMATLGSGATLSLGGERATVTLRNVPASALGPWLAQVRSNAHTLPTEAHLTRNSAAPAVRPPASASSAPAPAPQTAAAAWDGTLVLMLPPH